MATKSKTFNFGNKASSSKMEIIEVVCKDLEVDAPDEIIFGEEVASFSFVKPNTPANELKSTSPKSTIIKSETPKSESDPNVLNPPSSPSNEIKNNAPRSVKGSTPTIDGESFTIKRGYLLRPSTVRKLNELRLNHDDINVHLNTVLDEAILFYHDYKIKK